MIEEYSNSEYIYLLKTQEKLCKVIKDKANIGRRIRRAYKENMKQELTHIADIEMPELIAQTEIFYKTFQKQWMMESKSFGFEIQTIRIGGLLQRFSDVKQVLCEYLLDEKKRVEELEETELPFHYFLEDTPQTLNYNLWSDIVSPGVIG